MIGFTKDELNKLNTSVAKSLEEWLEENLSIHRLGLVKQLERSFTTTKLDRIL